MDWAEQVFQRVQFWVALGLMSLFLRIWRFSLRFKLVLPHLVPQARGVLGGGVDLRLFMGAAATIFNLARTFQYLFEKYKLTTGTWMRHKITYTTLSKCQLYYGFSGHPISKTKIEHANTNLQSQLRTNPVTLINRNCIVITLIG